MDSIRAKSGRVSDRIKIDLIQFLIPFGSAILNYGFWAYFFRNYNGWMDEFIVIDGKFRNNLTTIW